MDAEAVQLLDLVGLIYDAVLRPGLWNEVLERASGFVGGMGASIARQDAIRKFGNAYYTWGMDLDYEKLYFEKYIHHNPVAPLALAASVGDISSSSKLFAPEKFVETRFYKEWVKPQGLIDSMFCILERSTTSLASFIIFRHERDGIADDKAFELFGALVPHLRRAILIGNVLEHKTTDAQRFSDLLDRIKAGVFVVDAAGNTSYSNEAANDIIRAGDYLRSAGGKLSARQPEANQLLQEAIRAAGDGDTAMGGKSIAIPLMASDGTRYLANLLPLARRRADGIDAKATAAVFVQKAVMELPNPPDAIASVYKLTKTELRVLLALVQLGGGPEIAEALGVSTGTVKTHLRRLFQKTGTKSQNDLVKLVAGFSRPLIG